LTVLVPPLAVFVVAVLLGWSVFQVWYASPLPFEVHHSSWIADRFVRYLRDGRDRDRPFCAFLGFPLFGESYEPWIIFIMPPGGFFAIGFYLLLFAWWRTRRGARPQVRQWPHGVGDQTRRVA